MRWIFTLPLLVLGYAAAAQTTWPVTLNTRQGEIIKLYEWQPESFENNILKARAAFSISSQKNEAPVFGVLWLTASFDKQGQYYTLRDAQVTSLKLPDENTADKNGSLTTAIESTLPGAGIRFTRDQLDQAVQLNEKQQELSNQLNTTPPRIIYSRQPAILVYIDGEPRLELNADWGLNAVVNSPFTIIRNRDNRFYLYGGQHWYSAAAVTGPYELAATTPDNLKQIESSIQESYKKNNGAEEKNDYTISKVIVSTEPAELIQTNGEAEFAAVQGTGLLYVRNTDNDLFLDVSSQQYYVLLSGRWYKSGTLSGKWQYVGADRLPADFARIPANSEKGDVLASVAGTDVAADARQDAELPQTAKVDRNTASLDVTYDGDPVFEDIDGTSLAYVVNSPYPVLRYRNRYYAVDNGVWFEAYAVRGPWRVATIRPYDVALIPSRYPVYYVKYVYIYDVYPDYVYMGYTPGYLNTYVYGPTIVYGTGYYYRPWHRRYYYPRPCTWGYNIRYSPWYGWSFGISYNWGWFSYGYNNSYWGCSRSGWWGPSYYRPNYCYNNYSWGYRNNYNYYNNRYNVNYNYINYNNNIYNRRRDVVTRDNPRYSENRRNDWGYGNRNGNDRYRNDNYNNRNGNTGGYGNNRPNRGYDPQDNRGGNGSGYGNNNGRNNGNGNGNGYGNNRRENGRPDWQNPSRENERNNNRYDQPGNNQSNRNLERPDWQTPPPSNNRNENNNGANRNNNGRPDWQNPGRENNNNRQAERRYDPPANNTPNRNLERPDWQAPPPPVNRPENRPAPQNNNNGRNYNAPEPSREYRPGPPPAARESAPPSNQGGGQRPPERGNNGGGAQENRRPGRGR